MSFILDALRKSDAERQRTVTPGLSDVRYAAHRARRNVWLPVLAVVLAANVVFMGVQWFGRSSEHPAPPAESAAGAPAVDQPAATVAPAPAAEIRPLAREAEFGEPALEPPLTGEFPGGPVPAPAPIVLETAEPASWATTPDPGKNPAPATAPLASPVAGAVSAESPPPSRIVAGNELPTAEQLIGSGTLNIPLLNLDLHVYSEKPASRFVVINTRKYKEGAQLTEGPTVESITRDGAILASQGRRFTLSRK